LEEWLKELFIVLGVGIGVTGFVFKANPQSVEKYYKYQKKDYSKQLFENNKESFKISGTDTIYTGDLKFIPIFK